MQALALKYRPKNFDEVVGQEIVVKSLKSALANERLVHAYLFSGLRGSGKTSSARIFAKALLCENLENGKPCEYCQSCLDANAGKSVDIIEIDGASNRKIDDIRDLIEQTKYAPHGKYKIFIIDEVHMLTKEAFNAFLKTLEEPPNYVKFILATTDPLKLPQTILSRTQHFKFSQISSALIAQHLENILIKENISYEKSALEFLAKNSSGSLRDSLTQLDQAIVYSNFSLTKASVLSMLGYLSLESLEEIFSSIKAQDRENLTKLLNELQAYDTNLILDEIMDYLKEDFLSKKNSFSLEVYSRFFKILNEAKYFLSINSDSYFTILMTFFLMMQALQEKLPQAKEEEKSLEAFEKLLVKQALPEEESKPDKYKDFLQLLSQRNALLGQIFSKEIEFIKFENDFLFVKSKAQEEAKQLLRSSSRLINATLREIYGANSKMKVESLQVEEKSNFITMLDTLMQQEKKNKEDDINEKLASMQAQREEKKIDANEILLDELKRLFGEPKIS